MRPQYDSSMRLRPPYGLDLDIADTVSEDENINKFVIKILLLRHLNFLIKFYIIIRPISMQPPYDSSTRLRPLYGLDQDMVILLV